jgi:multidrug efflux system membrane fusion protein
VSFAIPEAQLPVFKRYLTQGTVRVTAQPPNDTGDPPAGRITFVDNAVDQSTGTIKIKGTFPNENRHLWPGQYVNVTVTLTTDPRAVVVPTAAVQNGQQGQFVFVVKPDQTVDLRPVSIARTNGSETVIQTGVQPGETVVTDGQLRLTAGSRISVKGSRS